jgi:hypothetical protein
LINGEPLRIEPSWEHGRGEVAVVAPLGKRFTLSGNNLGKLGVELLKIRSFGSHRRTGQNFAHRLKHLTLSRAYCALDQVLEILDRTDRLARVVRRSNVECWFSENTWIVTNAYVRILVELRNKQNGELGIPASWLGNLQVDWRAHVGLDEIVDPGRLPASERIRGEPSWHKPGCRLVDADYDRAAEAIGHGDNVLDERATAGLVGWVPGCCLLVVQVACFAAHKHQVAK